MGAVVGRGGRVGSFHLPAHCGRADLGRPDADLRVWLPAYATTHPCQGFRRAGAALRHDEGREVNKNTVHRLGVRKDRSGGRIRRVT
ncbi:MAG: hypothetical protein QJR12_16745 [Mycobacterium sp.]|uniref:hypothetical protein n=1 Tax=Mycobacterium sp. TaxID=1785 RepID=UPI00260F2625|nr:hypothetical protein [Mycobacterium sp.]MDI3315855.1 hypothetical protein [Mycobacterium sp.]